MIIEDASNSGDSIILEKLGGEVYVKKTIRKDIFRAKKSILKQQRFNYIALGNNVKISAVDVFDVKEGESYVEFKMPYVEGVVASEYALNGSRAMGVSVSKSISLLLYEELSQSVDIEIDSKIFIDKVKDIKNKSKKKVFDDHFAETLNVISCIGNNIKIPAGRCHGDLTLSNIIFSTEGGCQLIDFLDSFIESPLQDVAKIRQDFEFGWSFRRMDENSILKAKIFCKSFMPRAVLDIERLYPLASKIFLHMTLLRICPYVEDSKTEQWLLNSMDLTLKRLTQNG